MCPKKTVGHMEISFMKVQAARKHHNGPKLWVEPACISLAYRSRPRWCGPTVNGISVKGNSYLRVCSCQFSCEDKKSDYFSYFPKSFQKGLGKSCPQTLTTHLFSINMILPTSYPWHSIFEMYISTDYSIFFCLSLPKTQNFPSNHQPKNCGTHL